jgi:hypothetical protein
MIALSLLLLMVAAQAAAQAQATIMTQAQVAYLLPTVLGDNDAVINSPDKSSTACESGSINIDKEGTQCTAVPQCTAQFYLEKVENLETEAPISLEPGKVVGTNSLNLVVQHAAVKGRIVTAVVLKDGANGIFHYFTSIFL